MQMHISDLPAGTYVAAVSGGVDSVCLLHMLQERSDLTVVVAHFDHGIRTNSHEDAAFTAALASTYGMRCELGEGKLGADASEAAARQARYEFLFDVMRATGAKAVLTAHHQDDLIETAVINLIRGTGRRGLSPMRGARHVLRPLLHLGKRELLAYAEAHRLAWREDETNSDMRYLRNRVRHILLARADEAWREAMLERIMRADELNRRIQGELDSVLERQLSRGRSSVSRRWMTAVPYAVGAEFMHAWLSRFDVADIDQRLVERLVVAVRAARAGKRFDIDKRHYLLVTKRSARMISRLTGKSVQKA